MTIQPNPTGNRVSVIQTNYRGDAARGEWKENENGLWYLGPYDLHAAMARVVEAVKGYRYGYVSRDALFSAYGALRELTGGE
jgi:hypothetical protein